MLTPGLHTLNTSHQASDEALLQECSSVLSSAELAAAAEARNEGVRRQRLLTRALVRHTLAKYAEVKRPEQVSSRRSGCMGTTGACCGHL